MGTYKVSVTYEVTVEADTLAEARLAACQKVQRGGRVRCTDATATRLEPAKTWLEALASQGDKP